ncbi:MAG: hypothetical protein C0602_06205 [Denitrovibrio sp.]|nr:MAG: hypothetical protein C0602_06205 [Denitrovibrio sp.]
MLHRPVKQVIAFSCYEMGHTNINKFLERSQYGTLLTGDFNLNSDRNFLEDFEQYYLADINSAYILQLPHHGAVSSNSKRALEYMRNVRYCIASHGISNRHRHPDYEVIYYTTKEDKEFVHVHDKNDVLNIEF